MSSSQTNGQDIGSLPESFRIYLAAHKEITGLLEQMRGPKEIIKREETKIKEYLGSVPGHGILLSLNDKEQEAFGKSGAIKLTKPSLGIPKRFLRDILIKFFSEVLIIDRKEDQVAYAESALDYIMVQRSLVIKDKANIRRVYHK